MSLSLERRKGMDRGGIAAGGKISTGGGHTTRIEGLNKFLDDIIGWPEIHRIYVGPFKFIKGKSGGGFTFKATQLLFSGTRATGIKCQARNGTVLQQVVLYADDLTALKAKLQQQGYGANW